MKRFDAILIIVRNRFVKCLLVFNSYRTDGKIEIFSQYLFWIAFFAHFLQQDIFFC